MSGPFRAQSLASGSSGNALLIEAGRTLIAVDCGLGARGLAKALVSLERSPADIDAVLLTHEHADHASGVETMIKAGVPIVATAGTARAARVPGGATVEARFGGTTRVGEAAISAIPVSHDAAEPAGFRIDVVGRTITVLTDLGRPDDRLCKTLADSDLIVLEANHDVDLLRTGPYPAHLKRRVLSPTGHLSNGDCAELLAVALQRLSRPRTVWLAHLSQTNNRPALAVATVEQRLARSGIAVALSALPRRSPGPVWDAAAVPLAAAQLAMPGF